MNNQDITPAMRDFLRVAADSDAPDEIILTQEELRLKKMIIEHVRRQEEAANQPPILKLNEGIHRPSIYLQLSTVFWAIAGSLIVAFVLWNSFKSDRLAKNDHPPNIPKKPGTIVDKGKTPKDKLPVAPPQNAIAKTPDDKPSPLVVKDKAREDIEARIAPYADTPPNPDDPEVIALHEEAGRYLKEHREPNSFKSAIAKFHDASTQTPEHRKLYCETRAKQLLRNPDKNSPGVRELRTTLFGFRYSEDNRMCFLSLDDFLHRTEPDDPAITIAEWKPQVASLIERLVHEESKIEDRSPKIVGQNEPLDSAMKRGPYLLCVLPPMDRKLRDEANKLYRDIQEYSRTSTDPPDEVFVDFLARVRRPVDSDTLGVIVPLYSPDNYRIGTQLGADNWNRLIAAGNSGVQITGVVNIIINLDQLQLNSIPRDDEVYRTITNAKMANIKMLACLDCSPGSKTTQSLGKEIDLWFQLYDNLDGFFIYNTDNNFIANIYNYIRNNYGYSKTIVHSAKTFPEENMIKETRNDKNFIVFTDQSGMPIENFTPPSWITKYDPNRFAGSFQSTQANLAISINLAAAKHLGSVCFSDNTSQLPNYWPNEVTLIRQLNARIIGTRTSNNPAAKKKAASKTK